MHRGEPGPQEEWEVFNKVERDAVRPYFPGVDRAA